MTNSLTKWDLLADKLTRIAEQVGDDDLQRDDVMQAAQYLRECGGKHAHARRTLPVEATPEMIAAVSTILQPYAAKLVWKRMFDIAKGMA